MNIFAVNQDPVTAANMMCDKHIVSQLKEQGQILCTNWIVLGLSPHDGLYRPTHINHPSTVWARSSYENYQWLLEHFKATNAEYCKRYKHSVPHKTFDQLRSFIHKIPASKFPLRRLTPVSPAMRPEFHINPGKTWIDVIDLYRNYYLETKQPFAYWTERAVPAWYRKACEVKGMCEYEGTYPDGRRYRFMHTE